MRRSFEQFIVFLAMVTAVCWMPAIGRDDRADAQTTTSMNPVDFYDGVDRMMPLACPSSSDRSFPQFPPFGQAWDEMAKAAFDAEHPALTRVREARTIQHADWPAFNQHVPTTLPAYLNAMRDIANHLGDAALYEHFHGHDAAAIDTLEDLFVMSHLLNQQPWNSPFRLLVAGGFRAVRDNWLLIIASDVQLTNDPADHERLQVGAVRRLIDRLLTQDDPETQLNAANLAAKTGDQDVVVAGQRYTAATLNARAIETLNRVNAEQTFTAMSLACHLFFMDHQRWPSSIDELIPAYLPHKMIDSWGDGHQTIGYVLLKNGLPDGSDRPLVYSRCGSTGKLFYRVDQPEYGFYTDDGTNANRPHPNPSGQFRDVASWVPTAASTTQPTTRPFP